MLLGAPDDPRRGTVTDVGRSSASQVISSTGVLDIRTSQARMSQPRKSGAGSPNVPLLNLSEDGPTPGETPHLPSPRGFLCFRQRQNDPPNFILEVVMFGMVFPYLIFEGGTLMWTYVYHICPAAVYGFLTVCLVLAIGLIVHAWQFVPRAQKRPTLQEDLPGFLHPKRNEVWGVFLLLMTLAGCLVGRHNYYKNIFPIISFDDHQVYRGILPSSNPSHFQDAGVIYFASAAYVDPSMYRSFQYQGTSFCAAPILDGSAQTGFFATGIDCCVDTFECGTGSHGIVLRRYEERIFAPPSQEEYFFFAAKAASETFGVAIRTSPLFVELTTDATAMRKRWQSHAFGYALLPSLVGILACIIVATTNIIVFRRKLK